MEKNLFEMDGNVDVEALMARIRESTKQPGSSIPVSSAPREREQRSLKALQPQRLTQEIHSGSASTEVINHIPLKRRGTKGLIEFQIKKLLKWLVHWNTRGQADFNRSVMRSLGLIAQDLQTGQSNFAIVESLLRDVQEQGTRSRQEADQHMEHISSKLETIARNSNSLAHRVLVLEKQTSQRMQEIKQKMQKESGDLEKRMQKESGDLEKRMQKESGDLEKRMQKESGDLEKKLQELEERNTQSTQQVFAQINRLSKIVEEVGKSTEVIAARSFESERKMNRVLEEIRQNIVRSSELEGKLGHELDEVRMRILRAERIANTASRDTAAAEHEDVGKRVPASQTKVHNHKTNGQEKAATLKPVPSREVLGRPFDYFLFEHRHRGPVFEIKRRQSAYLDLFRDKKNVADLGCGRGEFVELLSENGINVTGVDNNEDMVDFCRDRGLYVVEADIFDYLGSLPEASLDGVFLAQVIEHLPPEQILRLVGLCAEKLEPGGVIVAETVNTNCPEALSNFYLDPTHIRPVPAEMLRFILEQASFQVECLKFSSPLPGNNVSEVLDLKSGLNNEANIYQDYAVVARRS